MTRTGNAQDKHGIFCDRKQGKLLKILRSWSCERGSGDSMKCI